MRHSCACVIYVVQNPFVFFSIVTIQCNKDGVLNTVRLSYVSCNQDGDESKCAIAV